VKAKRRILAFTSSFPFHLMITYIIFSHTSLYVMVLQVRKICVLVYRPVHDVSFAHFHAASSMRTKPVSLGRSSPRMSRLFMTETNSLLLSVPFSSSSNTVKTTSTTCCDNSCLATVFATYKYFNVLTNHLDCRLIMSIMQQAILLNSELLCC